MDQQLLIRCRHQCKHITQWPATVNYKQEICKIENLQNIHPTKFMVTAGNYKLFATNEVQSDWFSCSYTGRVRVASCVTYLEALSSECELFLLALFTVRFSLLVAKIVQSPILLHVTALMNWWPTPSPLSPLSSSPLPLPPPHPQSSAITVVNQRSVKKVKMVTMTTSSPNWQSWSMCKQTHTTSTSATLPILISITYVSSTQL